MSERASVATETIRRTNAFGACVEQAIASAKGETQAYLSALAAVNAERRVGNLVSLLPRFGFHLDRYISGQKELATDPAYWAKACPKAVNASDRAPVFHDLEVLRYMSGTEIQKHPSWKCPNLSLSDKLFLATVTRLGIIRPEEAGCATSTEWKNKLGPYQTLMKAVQPVARQ